MQLTESDNQQDSEKIIVEEEEIVKEESQEFKQQEEEKEEEELIKSSPINIESETDYQQEQPEEIKAEEILNQQDQFELELITDEMDSQLNPEAKEFIPVSPVSGRAIDLAMDLQSTPPFENGTAKSPFVNQLLSNFDDAVVAQSPRKGDNTLIMEDVQIPDNENEFDLEANARPHEVNLLDENFQRIDSPSAKEAMQVDDKLEQGYLDDSQQAQQKENQQKEQDSFFEEEKHQESDEYKVLESSFEQYSNGFQSKIDDAMNRSFYEGRDGNILETNASDVLNTVQPIPSFEDDQPEANIENGNDKPEADLAVVVEPIFVAEEISKVNTEVNIQQEVEQEMIESSDNFEAEHIVEEIKGIISENKYVDTELSPTVADFVPSIFQSPPVVEEEIIATHTSFKEELIGNLEETIAVETLKVDNLEAPHEEIPAVVDAEIQLTEFKDIPEVIEAIVQEVAIEPAKTEPKTEVAVAKIKAPLAAAAPKKATSTTTSSKLAAKPTEVKKPDNKPKTATSTMKPASGLASKPPLSKPTSTVKPIPSSTATAAPRAKPTASIPPIRKPTSSSSLAAKTITKTESKPAVKAATSSSVPPKRPVTSAFTAR